MYEVKHEVIRISSLNTRSEDTTFARIFRINPFFLFCLRYICVQVEHHHQLLYELDFEAIFCATIYLLLNQLPCFPSWSVTIFLGDFPIWMQINATMIFSHCVGKLEYIICYDHRSGIFLCTALVVGKLPTASYNLNFSVQNVYASILIATPGKDFDGFFDEPVSKESLSSRICLVHFESSARLENIVWKLIASIPFLVQIAITGSFGEVKKAIESIRDYEVTSVICIYVDWAIVHVVESTIFEDPVKHEVHKLVLKLHITGAVATWASNASTFTVFVKYR